MGLKSGTLGYVGGEKRNLPCKHELSKRVPDVLRKRSKFGTGPPQQQRSDQLLCQNEFASFGVFSVPNSPNMDYSISVGAPNPTPSYSGYSPLCRKVRVSRLVRPRPYTDQNLGLFERGHLPETGLLDQAFPGHSVSSLGDLERPWELQMHGLVVVNELGHSAVAATRQHAARRLHLAERLLVVRLLLCVGRV